MTDLRQAAQVALQALEGWEHCDKWVWPATALEQAKRNTTESLAALRAALKQQAEPVMLNGLTEAETNATASVMGLIKQAEPVAWMDREGDLYKMPEITNWAPPHIMLYTTPPQRQWVGLTDEEITELRLKNFDAVATNYESYRAIEAKLKEKNNG